MVQRLRCDLRFRLRRVGRTEELIRPCGTLGSIQSYKILSTTFLQVLSEFEAISSEQQLLHKLVFCSYVWSIVIPSSTQARKLASLLIRT